MTGMMARILGLLAETHVHPGAGQSEQAIDLPVARERTTGFPFVPGSGVKGAMRDRAERMFGRDSDEIRCVYGKAEGAGDLVVSDARLLLLPVRSLSRAYVWLTCPYLIERLRRDRERSLGDSGPKPEFSPLTAGAGKDPRPPILCAGGDGELVFLEERLFRRVGNVPREVVQLIEPLVAVEEARGRLRDQIAVVPDGEFAWFARHALPVHAHNVLDDETKASTNLWYEESLPPDTLLYVVALYRQQATADHLGRLFERPWLQLGGNETTGQGWLRVAMVGGGAA